MVQPVTSFTVDVPSLPSDPFTPLVGSFMQAFNQAQQLQAQGRQLEAQQAFRQAQLELQRERLEQEQRRFDSQFFEVPDPNRPGEVIRIPWNAFDPEQIPALLSGQGLQPVLEPPTQPVGPMVNLFGTDVPLFSLPAGVQEVLVEREVEAGQDVVPFGMQLIPKIVADYLVEQGYPDLTGQPYNVLNVIPGALESLANVQATKALASQRGAEAEATRLQSKWVDAANAARIQVDLERAGLDQAKAMEINKTVDATVANLEADTDRLKAIAEQARAETLTIEETRGLMADEIRSRIEENLAGVDLTRAQIKDILDTLDARIREIAANADLAAARVEDIRREGGELNEAEKTALAGLLGVPAADVVEQRITRAQFAGLRDLLDDIEEGQTLTVGELLNMASEATGLKIPAPPLQTAAQPVAFENLEALRGFVRGLTQEFGPEEERLSVGQVLTLKGYDPEIIPDIAFEQKASEALVESIGDPSPLDIADIENEDLSISVGDAMAFMGFDDIPEKFYKVDAPASMQLRMIESPAITRNLTQTPQWEIFQSAFDTWSRQAAGDQGLDTMSWLALAGMDPQAKLAYLQGGNGEFQTFGDWVRQNAPGLVEPINAVLESLGAPAIVLAPPVPVAPAPSPEVPTPLAPEPEQEGPGFLGRVWNWLGDNFGISPAEPSEAAPAVPAAGSMDPSFGAGGFTQALAAAAAQQDVAQPEVEEVADEGEAEVSDEIKRQIVNLTDPQTGKRAFPTPQDLSFALRRPEVREALIASGLTEAQIDALAVWAARISPRPEMNRWPEEFLEGN